jgi:hypothetical protein
MPKSPRLRAPDPLPNAKLERLPARAVSERLRAAVEGGARIQPAGNAPSNLEALYRAGYVPRHEFALFDARFFLTGFRYNDVLNFVVAYVGIAAPGERLRSLYPRIFYKDLSLVWRAASHVCTAGGGVWIGKGDTRWERRRDGLYEFSAEETTNLPYEMQGALDRISHAGPAKRDARALSLFLRDGPMKRIIAYADFVRPRRRAAAQGAPNGGRPVARFARPCDPRSLVFARGYAPDFAGGLLDVERSTSRLYGGRIAKYRIRSENGAIQYQFVAARRHVWLNPPQTLTRELSTYGVRTLDVLVPEELCVPGYEYHFLDEEMDPPRLHSQIPAGYAGARSASDPSRADASRWNEALPVIREFRRRVLGR